MAEDTESAAVLTEIPASEILDKIQKGEPVEYDHVRVVGDLDLGKLNLPIESVARTKIQMEELQLPAECKIISSPITITNSKFYALIDFSNCLFKNRTSFKNTTFSRDANFRGADFWAATFRGWHADFSGATFSRGADFSEAIFSGGADFSEAIFSGVAIFSGATFSRDADFIGATFSRGAHFSGATFSGDAIFIGAAFSQYARFTKTAFSEVAYFMKVTFSGNVDFYGAAFSKGPSFAGAKFEGDLLTFRDAAFNLVISQEEACRRAKNVLAKAGNRDEEEYHFHREMGS